MGLKVGEVKLESWTPRWRESFETEKQNLKCIFNELAIDIQHIGSTAVDGLDAKPIIDIAIGVQSLRDFEKVRHFFESSSEYSIKLDNAPDEILVRKGSEENRTHFIHIMEVGGRRMIGSLKFRNILRNDTQMRNDYCKLKHKLAKRFPHNRGMYTTSKASFIAKALNS